MSVLRVCDVAVWRGHCAQSTTTAWGPTAVNTTCEEGALTCAATRGLKLALASMLVGSSSAPGTTGVIAATFVLPVVVEPQCPSDVLHDLRLQPGVSVKQLAFTPGAHR